MNNSNLSTRLILGAILGIAAAVLAFLGNPSNMALCIACFIRDTAGSMKLHSAAVVQYFRPEVVGIVCGAFLISIVTKEYRSTSGSSPMIRFLLGVIMMIGSLVFLGCPLRLLIRLSAGDLNAVVALPGFILGIFTGTLALKRGFTLGRAYPTKDSSGYVLPGVLVFLFVLSLTTALFVSSESGPGSKHAPVIAALIGGLVFGAVAQKSRTCFAGGFRDVILMRNFDLLSVLGGLFVVMLVFNLATGGFKLSFAGQPVAHSQHLWNFLGMYVVGFAAVLAGQGSSDSAVTFLGLLVGAAFCHNFGLAASAAAAATETAEAVVGGPGPAGKAAVLICIAVLFLIGFLPSREKK